MRLVEAHGAGGTPGGLARQGAQALACPPGLHRATFRRLLRERVRVLAALRAVASRRVTKDVRRRLVAEFSNRLHWIDRALGLPVTNPRRKRWYRMGAAAAFVGVSPKTLQRWTARGVVDCGWSASGQQRRYAHSELVRLVRSLRV